MVDNPCGKKSSIFFLREILISWMKKYSQYVITQEKVEKLLNISTAENKRKLKQTLRLMKHKKDIIFIKKKTYVLLDKKNVFKGTVIGNRNGYGFLKSSSFKKDCWLSKSQMKLCMHGDTISVCIFKVPNNKRHKVVVIKIHTKIFPSIVGKCLKNKKNVIVVPYDLRFNFKILIVNSYKKMFLDSGFTVLVKIIKRSTSNKLAQGIACKVLGKSMDIKLAIYIALQKNSIPFKFSKEIKSELLNIAEDIPDRISREYVDLRHLPFITIDDEDACDYDDAICCRKNNNGTWKLFVAISDVSYYVKPNSILDEEAKNRGTSIYFPSLSIPMLPEKLSKNICSLIPKKDRLTIVCRITLSSKGEVIRYNHYKAIINSHACLTYYELSKLWNNEKIFCKKYLVLLEDIRLLYQLYIVLRSSVVLKKRLSFKKKECKFVFFPSLRIKKVDERVSLNSHELIELCMILTNFVTAEFLIKNNSLVVFRNHESPEKKNIKNCQILLNNLGLKLSRDMRPFTSDYLGVLKQLSLSSNYKLIEEILLRSMNPAIYNNVNKGHFALALPSYVHFTSPIRRYPDLLVHRAVKYEIEKRKKPETNTFIESNKSNKNVLKEISNNCSLAERRAEFATREVAEWLKCDYIKKKIGKIFIGTIFHVVKFGFFVRINNLFVDGLVFISTISDDNYYYDKNNQQFIGKKTKISFSLGDRVKVKIHTIVIEERRIELKLISKIANSVKKSFFVRL